MSQGKKVSEEVLISAQHEPSSKKLNGRGGGTKIQVLRKTD